MLDQVEERAPAKINLSLHVLGRRADGYHELDSIVGFADIGDRLILRRSDGNELSVSGPFAAAVPLGADNIIWKAWHVLKALRDIPTVTAILEKNLPVASGIGGGSADAAAMLRGLLRLNGLQLGAAQISGLARSLGADIPVCFYGKPCQMRGIGETVRPLNIALPPAIVLVNPGLACETAAVFKAMGLSPGQTYKGEIALQEPGSWRNDMTAAAIAVQPAIADVLQALQDSGLETFRMSGSGATCFGLAHSLEEAEKAATRMRKTHADWWIRPARLL